MFGTQSGPVIPGGRQLAPLNGAGARVVCFALSLGVFYGPQYPHRIHHRGQPLVVVAGAHVGLGDCVVVAHGTRA